MALVAVASVVKEKVKEMMKKKSALTFAYLIRRIIREVEKGERLLTDEEEKEEDHNHTHTLNIKEWERQFCRILYELEDVVETTHARRKRKRKLMSYLNLDRKSVV